MAILRGFPSAHMVGTSIYLRVPVEYLYSGETFIHENKQFTVYRRHMFLGVCAVDEHGDETYFSPSLKVHVNCDIYDRVTALLTEVTVNDNWKKEGF